jgi:hypothetical protein
MSTQHERDAQEHEKSRSQPSHYLNQGSVQPQTFLGFGWLGWIGNVGLFAIVVYLVYVGFFQQPQSPRVVPSDNPNIIQYGDK